VFLDLASFQFLFDCVNMCLWFVQMCPECEKITPIPWEEPQVCDLPVCLRKELDPRSLSQEDDQLNRTNECNKHCQFNYCGAYVRFATCGFGDALSDKCSWSDTSESE